MEKRMMSLLVAAAFMFSLTACSGAKKQGEETAAQAEEAAVIAGSVPKSLLAEEVKTETVQLLRDLPDSDIPYRMATGEVKMGVGDLSYMLPVSKASELTTPAQKARAIGIYFADYNILKALGQPTADVEGVLAKLTSGLNITYLLNILQQEPPAPSSHDEYAKFLEEREDRIIEALAADDKVDIQIELLGGLTAELALVYANPSLVVQGDVATAGLTDNQLKRLDILGQITADLAAYYPDLAQLADIISPLKDKVASVKAARNANAEITGIRDALLK
ncbi:MAG: hypothetical protein LBQ78_01050 [Tannerellaceae bacterium]|jgi:hypothetical protein|nr:hypothetical protein [Tannerellaceae bacterium]